MNKQILSVEGMSCNHCVNSIEGALNRLGVNEVKVSLAEGKVEVSFDGTKLTIDDIKNEIKEQGYDVL